MKCVESFVAISDKSDFFSHNNAKEKNGECSFCRTNIWNSSFDSPEINCDFSVLHTDLQEIKELVQEISCCLKDFFREE